MAWYDEFIQNLAESADPVKNLKALFGIMPEETLNGQPVNIGMPTGGRAVARAGRSLVPAGRSVVRAGRDLARSGGRRAAGEVGDNMFAEVIEVLRNQSRQGGRLAGGGRPAVSSGRRALPSPVRQTTTRSGRNIPTSSNRATVLTDQANRVNRGRVATAAVAGLAGTGAVRNMMGGRTEGTGAQGQVVVPSVDPTTGHATPQDAFAGPGSSYGLDPDPANTNIAPEPADPTESLLEEINSQYDRWGGMIDNMAATYDNLAQTNMQEIADIFGETAGVAQGGIAPVGSTYAQGQQSVGDIYNDLDSRLGGISGELQGIADTAAGSAAGDVATVSEAAIAPFEAASANARASAQANMAQHSNASQDYLSNLASASTEEGKMHAGRVQAAAQARAAEFDIRRMELEMAREEALREVAMDAAGSAAERQATAALFEQAGIAMPPGMDMDGAQAYVNLGQDLGLFSTGEEADEEEMLRASLSPAGQEVLNRVIQTGEQAWTTAGEDPVGDGDRAQDFVFDLLAALDDEVASAEQMPTLSTGPGMRDEEGNYVRPRQGDWLDEADIIRQIIRNEYGKF